MIAIYARVSTEEQAKHGFSIYSQIRECQAMVPCEQSLTFIDEGVSGEILERPALNQLREKIDCGEVTTVICLDPDRLSRKLLHQLLLTEEWENKGVHLSFVNGEYQKTPEGNLFYALRGAISEFEKAQITERMCRGRREKARQGKVLRDFQIYGYDYNDETEQLVINSVEGEIVSSVFSWYLQESHGMKSISSIARMLTNKGIPTKRGASKWHRQVVRQILSNRTYIGEFYQNKWDTTGGKVRLRPRKDWILIPCPPLITKVTYDKVQKKLSLRSRS